MTNQDLALLELVTYINKDLYEAAGCYGLPFHNEKKGDYIWGVILRFTEEIRCSRTSSKHCESNTNMIETA